MNYLVLLFIGIIIGFVIIFIYHLIHGSKKDGKKKKILRYKCLDGHLVKSRGELIIDNYLNKLGLKHIYEDTIYVGGKPVKYDWFLPDFHVYIEYWGLNSKKYLKRKDKKLRLYKKGNLKLISIENSDLYNIYEVLFRKLKKFIDSRYITGIKHCPNCGNKLDNRF